MTETTHFVREDVRAFLDMLKALNGPTMSQIGPVAGREQMRTMGAMAESPARELAVIRDLACPGPAGEIPLRLYDSRGERGAGPCVVFFHGGGFVIGDIGVYDALCTEIAHHLDLPVVSVEYRLAPEHPFPAAPDDCEAAARWIAGSPADLGCDVTGLVIMGDSAGGNLTIVTANALGDRPAAVPVLVQAPIYPVADDVSRHRSFRDFAEGYLLTAETMSWFSAQYRGDPSDRRHTPLPASNDGTAPPAPASTPPTVLCTAGLDPLRDSGRAYAAHLVQQGTDVAYLEFSGIIHGFTTLRRAIPSGQADLERFLDAVKLMLEHRSAAGV